MLSKTTPTTVHAPKSQATGNAQILPGARIVLSRLFVVGVAAALLCGHSRWALPGSFIPELMMLLGIILATIAMAGRMWCSFFIAGRKNVVLVTQGPYALCRNPLYLFSLVGGVGVGLASGMFTVAMAIAIAFAIYYPVTIRREEAYLQQRHGDAFAAYCRAVPAFWPSLDGHADLFPEGVKSHSRVFFNHLSSAIWFPIACCVVHLMCRGHELGVLPMYFFLP